MLSTLIEQSCIHHFGNPLSKIPPDGPFKSQPKIILFMVLVFVLWPRYKNGAQLTDKLTGRMVLKSKIVFLKFANQENFQAIMTMNEL